MKGTGWEAAVEKPWLWISAGAMWVGLVIFLSVAAINLPQMPSTIGDKINHAIAYGFLMIWFGQIFHSNKSRICLAICFIGLGLAMEFVQSMLPHRWFDLKDGVANAVGVLLGLLALWCGADKMFTGFEQRLKMKNG